MTSYQKKILIKKFDDANPFLTKEQQHQLSISLNVSANRIAAWYAHRRFTKRQQQGLLAKREHSEIQSVLFTLIC